MSGTAAREFIARVENDRTLAADLEALRDDPQAVFARVRAEGFEVSAAEVREAFVERFGAELSPDQLDAIAAGTDHGLSEGTYMGLTLGLGGILAVGAGAAAAAV